MRAVIRHTLKALPLGLPFVLAACLAPSDLPAPRDHAGIGANPGLVSTASILTRTAQGPNTARLTATPEVRVAGLRARAAALRGPVIAPGLRARMLSADARLR